MDFEKQKPVTDQYRENWERAFHDWRTIPDLPGYCTVNLNGSSMTPFVAGMVQETVNEFGECHIVNGATKDEEPKK